MRISSKVSNRGTVVFGTLFLILLIVSSIGFRDELRGVMPLRVAYNWLQNLIHPPVTLSERGNGGPKDLIALAEPVGLAEDDFGNVYISERGKSWIGGRVIWKIDADGVARVIAGTGRRGNSRVDVPALESSFGSAEGIILDRAGRIYFADAWNHVVLRLELDGSLTRVAGTGKAGYNGDGIPAVQAELNEPYDVALDSQENIYIADNANHRIRMVGKDGVIHTFAGTGVAGYRGDGGPAKQAQLHGLFNIAVDSQDRIYIPDAHNHAIRRVDHDGIITTIAGTGRPGFAGDGGPATSAQVDGPQDIVFDDRGNLIFDDEHNHAIRTITPDGRISTLVGTGSRGCAADGTLATEAPLNDPEGILVRMDGTLLISDSSNKRILELTPDGKVRNFAGRQRPLSPDGRAPEAACRNGRHKGARLSLQLDREPQE